MNSKIKPYFLNSLLVTLFFIIISTVYQFTPFGSQTMLTIDLGQQYIDFYSLYKETLTNSPEMISYSFQKAIGGEMLGLWSYYLLSPFNLIFLLFNESNFELAVTLITYLKLVSSSLAFMYFTRNKYQLDLIPSLAFSLSYTLMSYSMVYLLNIMWLDGLILLPLIALGLDKLITGKGSILYVLSLASMFIANYYIAYMISIFLAMYALFIIIENMTEFKWLVTIKQYSLFVFKSINAALIAGITLLPTIYSLSKNKGSYIERDLTNNYVNIESVSDIFDNISTFLADFDFSPVHTLKDILSKFFVGSFNFDEMSSGSPNLYAGMLVLFFALLFFINKKIALGEKIMALVILLAFYLSFRFEILDKLWHGGQFPIWYHFRFSFTTTFFIIILAIKAFTQQDKRFPLSVLLIMMGSFTVFCGYYYWVDEYSFLSSANIYLSLLFFLLILFVSQMQHIKKSYRYLLILAIVSTDLTANSIIILDNLNYLQQSKFEDYTETLNDAIDSFRMTDDEFYRINKTFMRTKNEAMYVHYNGMDHFGSTIEAHVPRLYGYLGLPDGSGFASYTNGTLFLDDFFSIKYVIEPSTDSKDYTLEDEYILYPETTDLDNGFHPVIKDDKRYLIRENENYFGLGIEVSPEIQQETFNDHQAIANQDKLLSLIDYDGTGQSFFTEREFTNIIYKNVSIISQGDGDYYTYQNDSVNDSEDAQISWQFSTESNNPYYFTLPSQFSKDNVSMRLNNQRYRFYSPFRRRQVTNASFNLISDQQVLDIILKEDQLKANLIHLYEFDLARYESLVKAHENNKFVVSNFKHNDISGNININQDEAYLLFSIPYDESWYVTVDGEEVQTESVLNETLLAIPISQGRHQIRLRYKPASIAIGSLVSIIGIIILILSYYLKKPRKPK